MSLTLLKYNYLSNQSRFILNIHEYIREYNADKIMERLESI
jgi:hypothetical protein